MPLQDTITAMASFDLFLATLQRDTTLHQDLLSFVAQPWVDRPWFKINTHPAVAALFTDPARAPALGELSDVVTAVDRSLTEDQVKWFTKYLKDVSTAPVIYTGMTNLSARVFDYALLDAIDRTVDAAITPQRVDKVLAALKAALAAEVPASVVAQTPEGGNPVVQGTFAGFQAFWSKARRAKYLGVYDAIQTDEHYARVGKFMHQMLPFSSTESLTGLFNTLDAALPTPRLERLAKVMGSFLGGDWGLMIATRMDAALPASRIESLLAAIDQAADEERFTRLPGVLDALAEAITPPRVERAFQALEMLVSERRRAGYAALIDNATADPARCERYAAALERLLTPRTAGGMMDLAAVLFAQPGRLTKVARAMDDEWGDTDKLATWLDAVDLVNLGSDRTGAKLLAVADLATTTRPGCPSGVGLPNLWSALELAAADHRMEALGAALDRASLADIDAAADALASLPGMVRLLDALLPTDAALRLLRGLDTVMGEAWARKELESMIDVALGEEGGATAVLGSAGRIMWAVHGAMFNELLGGKK
uniref:Uncharacterized protein n=1 Tax=Chlamydomonas leiostraca TaxID=1034604 RepID=A0A7S0RT70_9CHLO